jgi:hypothetical protein
MVVFINMMSVVRSLLFVVLVIVLLSGISLIVLMVLYPIQSPVHHPYLITWRIVIVTSVIIVTSSVVIVI